MTHPSDPQLTADALAARRGRRAYLDDVVSTLWPLSVADGPGVPYVMVPNGENPAALVPRRPRRATAAAIRNHKSSADRRARAKFSVLSLAARAGAGDLLTARRTLRIGRDAADSITAYLQDELSREVHLSLYASSPRANRKPVLQILDSGGRGLGFAKVGLSSLAGRLVLSESQALEALGARTLDTLVVPRILSRGSWRGYPVLVQQSLGEGSGAGSSVQVQPAMVELGRLFGTQCHAVSSSPYVRTLRARLMALPETSASLALARALDDVCSNPVSAAEALELGAWHGDWTPWNMTLRGGRALVWDWERFEQGVPLGFDAIHYCLQGAIVRNRRVAQESAAWVVDHAMELLGPWGMAPQVARTVALLYLIEIGCRYEFDGQAAAGAALGDLGRWLLPVLASRAGG